MVSLETLWVCRRAQALVAGGKTPERSMETWSVAPKGAQKIATGVSRPLQSYQTGKIAYDMEVCSAASDRPDGPWLIESSFSLGRTVYTGGTAYRCACGEYCAEESLEELTVVAG